MVIIKLVGGLGNQMFQYAFGRSISSRLKTELKLDVSWFGQIDRKDTFREYELKIFENSNVFTNSLEDLKIKLSLVLRRFKVRTDFPFVVVSENENVSEISDFNKDYYCYGYWQSEDYFLEISELIRKDFDMERWVPKVDSQLLSEIENCNSVAVHVRRGDYVSNIHTSKVHQICGLDYYKRSMEYIQSCVNNPTFFFFSDDLNWVKANFKNDKNVVYVEGNIGSNNYLDMLLMSKVKHNIIANSSFSWWGAWLNKYSMKIVISPTKWFKDRETPNNLLPKEWIKL